MSKTLKQLEEERLALEQKRDDCMQLIIDEFNTEAERSGGILTPDGYSFSGGELHIWAQAFVNNQLTVVERPRVELRMLPGVNYDEAMAMAMKTAPRSALAARLLGGMQMVARAVGHPLVVSQEPTLLTPDVNVDWSGMFAGPEAGG